jgi:hypothetical protein
MVKTLTLGLLATSVAVLSPSVWRVLSEIVLGGFWFELGLLILGFASILLAAIASRRSGATCSTSAVTPNALAMGLLLAFFGVVWGWYTSDSVWVFRGWAVCLSGLICLSGRLSSLTFFHLACLAFFLPLSLWRLAPEIHSYGQMIATSFAGAILDLAKIFYFARGNVIGLVSTDFLENGQCSGLRLLGPALLVTLGYSFLCGYRSMRTIYLALVCVFWVLVLNGVRIAYFAWRQDNQPSPLSFNAPLADALCLLGILFLSWSANQFFEALRTKEVEPDPDQANSSGTATKGSSQAIYFVYGFLIGIVFIGSAILYRDSTHPYVRLSSRAIASALEGIKIPEEIEGWKLTEVSNSKESIKPVFKHGETWFQREWHLANQSDDSSFMQLRLEGPWSHPPQIDWHWRWFGWHLNTPIVDELEQFSWAMNRSIVEEAFVVSSNLGIASPDPSGSPVLQLSLIQQGYQPYSQEQQKSQKELFGKFRKAIEEQIRAKVSDGLDR